MKSDMMTFQVKSSNLVNLKKRTTIRYEDFTVMIGMQTVTKKGGNKTSSNIKISN